MRHLKNSRFPKPRKMERLWKINRTLLQKLEDTYYQVSAVDKKAVASIEDFEAAFPTRDRMERVFLPKVGTTAELKTPLGVLLFFAELEEDKKYIRVEDVRRLIAKMETMSVVNAFFITNAALSSKANDVLRNSQAPGKAQVVVFRDEEMLFNVTRHRRVPKHTLLSPAEANQWLHTVKLKRSQIPRIFEDEPQIKYLGGSSGDLIKVTGPSPTVGSFTRHLVVVRRLGSK